MGRPSHWSLRCDLQAAARILSSAAFSHSRHEAEILSGTYIQGPEGQPEFRLGPSSYLMQPGGTYRHTTSCDAASECIFFVESNGAFDLHLATAQIADPPE